MAIISDKRKSDAVKHPKHYELPGLGIECIDVIRAVTRTISNGYCATCRGNAIKYLIRAGRKSAQIEKWVEDLEKAKEYIDYEIQEVKASGRAAVPMSAAVSTCDVNEGGGKQ